MMPQMTMPGMAPPQPGKMPAQMMAAMPGMGIPGGGMNTTMGMPGGGGMPQQQMGGVGWGNMGRPGHYGNDPTWSGGGGGTPSSPNMGGGPGIPMGGPGAGMWGGTTTGLAHGTPRPPGFAAATQTQSGSPPGMPGSGQSNYAPGYDGSIPMRPGMMPSGMSMPPQMAAAMAGNNGSPRPQGVPGASPATAPGSPAGVSSSPAMAPAGGGMSPSRMSFLQSRPPQVAAAMPQQRPQDQGGMTPGFMGGGPWQQAGWFPSSMMGQQLMAQRM